MDGGNWNKKPYQHKFRNFQFRELRTFVIEPHQLRFLLEKLPLSKSPVAWELLDSLNGQLEEKRNKQNEYNFNVKKSYIPELNVWGKGDSCP